MHCQAATHGFERGPSPCSAWKALLHELSGSRRTAWEWVWCECVGGQDRQQVSYRSMRALVPSSAKRLE